MMKVAQAYNLSLPQKTSKHFPSTFVLMVLDENLSHQILESSPPNYTRKSISIRALHIIWITWCEIWFQNTTFHFIWRFYGIDFLVTIYNSGLCNCGLFQNPLVPFLIKEHIFFHISGQNWITSTSKCITFQIRMWIVVDTTTIQKYCCLSYFDS